MNILVGVLIMSTRWSVKSHYSNEPALIKPLTSATTSTQYYLNLLSYSGVPVFDQYQALEIVHM